MGAARLLFILAAPWLLASCLLTPGQFVSTLDIKRDRHFTFTYAGEVILTDPTSGFGEAASAGEESRAVAEVAAAKAEAMRVKGQAIAESLSKEVGYRSVEHLGDGRFRVDYAMGGRLDRNFVYPINLDAESFIPWIAIEVRKDGTARIKALAFGDDDKPAAGMTPDAADKPAMERSGTFTLTTDAELVMHNNEEGAADGKVVWQVTPTSKTVPTAVLRFAQ